MAEDPTDENLVGSQYLSDPDTPASSGSMQAPTLLDNLEAYPATMEEVTDESVEENLVLS